MAPKAGFAYTIGITGSGQGATERVLKVRQLDTSKVKKTRFDIRGSGDAAPQTMLYGAEGSITFTLIDPDDHTALLALNGTTVTVKHYDTTNGTAPGTAILTAAGVLDVPAGLSTPHGPGELASAPIEILVNAVPTALADA